MAKLRQSIPDSLQRQLAQLSADTNRVLLLGKLTHALRATAAPQARRYGYQGLRLAQKLAYPVGELLLLNELGNLYFVNEDLYPAARCFQQAMRQAGRVPGAQASRQLTLALLGLGRIAVTQHDYPESQRYFQQALRRARQRRYPEATRDLAAAQNGLSVLYFDWTNSGQAYPDSVRRLGLRYSRLALATLGPAAPEVNRAVGLNCLGLMHALNAHYDSAEYYHRAALARFRQANRPVDVAQTRVWLGNALVAQHRARAALPLLEAALASAARLRLPGLRADCALQLAAALAATGQSARAYRLAHAGQAMFDSLRQASQQADLARLRVQFGTEQARGQVRELTQRNYLQQVQAHKQRQRLWWLGSLLLAVAGGLTAVGGLAWRLRRQQRQLTRQHAELAAARAEQNRLYALIAHDLRSPVVAFDGLADLLTEYVAQQDTARLLRLGAHVRQTASSLRELLDNLLSWALLQRGELTPVPEPVAVNELLTKLRRLYQAAAETAGVRLVVLEAPAGSVRIDYNMTRAILRNLVSNAVQATPVGGTVTVRALPAADAAQLVLEVADTGVGMSPEELRRVTGGAAPQPQGRVNLGLRLSFAFAQAQATPLTLRSTPGLGTVATLALPCV